MEEEEEEPGICNLTTKNTFTYQLENILFLKKTGDVIFWGFANTPNMAYFTAMFLRWLHWGYKGVTLTRRRLQHSFFFLSFSINIMTDTWRELNKIIQSCPRLFFCGEFLVRIKLSCCISWCNEFEKMQVSEWVIWLIFFYFCDSGS